MKYTVVTGAAGFIGSCMVNKLNNKGLTNIIVVDDFSNPLKTITWIINQLLVMYTAMNL